MLGSALRSSLANGDTRVLQLVRGAPAGPNQLHWDPTSFPAVEDLKPMEGLAAVIHLSGASLAGASLDPVVQA